MPTTAHAAALQAPASEPVAVVTPTAEPSVEQRLLSLRELGHTLRTPLSAIIGFAEILAQEQRGPEDTHREYAEIIRQSGLQMLELVNQTLQGAADDIRRSAE